MKDFKVKIKRPKWDRDVFVISRKSIQLFIFVDFPLTSQVLLNCATHDFPVIGTSLQVGNTAHALP